MYRFMRFAAVMCVGVSLILGASSAVAAPPKLATIASSVRGTDGLPIPGAAVALSVLKRDAYVPVTTLVTDPTGEVSAEVKPGSYKLDISAPAADPLTMYVVAQKGVVLAQDITLQAYGAVSGTVRDLVTGAPVADATVTLYLRNADGTWPSEPTATLSAPTGTYASGQIGAGEYHVLASAPGYASGFHDGYGLGTATTVLVPRDTTVTDKDVKLTAVAQTGLITGRAVNGAAEAPLISANVFFYRQNDDGTWPATSPGWGLPTRSVYTTSNGTYTSGDLPLGNYKVRFFSTHTSSQWWQYVLTADAATVVTLDPTSNTLSNIDAWYNKP